MKQLRFSYEIQLAFSQEVTSHHFLLRCRPMESARQHCGNFLFWTEPAARILEVEDGFGNRGFSMVFEKPHDKLRVKSEGLVKVYGGDLGNCGEALAPMYRFPTPYTDPKENIRQFLEDARLARGQEIEGICGLQFLMDRLYGKFSYIPGVTDVKTTAADALSLGKGVCQDYAHIFISLLRLLGIPARYAAGVMVGEGASHAWAEAWLDGAWVGMDPTNNRLVDDTYIKFTHGRDFADAAIDKGCFHGFASQSQKVLVKVEQFK